MLVYMRTEHIETNFFKKNLSSTSKHREVPEPKLAGSGEKYCYMLVPFVQLFPSHPTRPDRSFIYTNTYGKATTYFSQNNLKKNLKAIKYLSDQMHNPVRSKPSAAI